MSHCTEKRSDYSSILQDQKSFHEAMILQLADKWDKCQTLH